MYFNFTKKQYIFIILGVCSIVGCHHPSFVHHDPYNKMSQHDYLEWLKKFPLQENIDIDVPSLPTKEEEKESLPSEFSQPVSIAMTEGVDMRSVLFNLASQIGASVIVSPAITSSLNFKVKDKPFINVLDQLCHLGDLKYELREGLLIIEPDAPYLKTYDLPYLSQDRSSQHSLNVSTEVPITSSQSPSSGQGKASLNQASSSSIEGKNNINFWDSVEKTIQMIVHHSLPAPSAPIEASKKLPSSYTIHKQAGLLSVWTTHKKHKEISIYLDQLRSAVSSQVLIEAKVIEVSLNEEFKSGINWNFIHQYLNIERGDFISLSDKSQVLSLGFRKDPSHILFNMLEFFGSARTLSNPHITIMNNHAAILKIARNEVYFKLNHLKERYDTRYGHESTTTTSEIHTVPVGIILYVQPSISLKDGQIILSLRPTITNTVQEVEDPAVSISSQGKIRSSIPVIQVREFDSVMKLKSGFSAILGGLILEKAHNKSSALPFIPHPSNPLLDNKLDQREIVELVVLLKATIIDAGQKQQFKEITKGFETLKPSSPQQSPTTASPSNAGLAKESAKGRDNLHAIKK